MSVGAKQTHAVGIDTSSPTLDDGHIMSGIGSILGLSWFPGYVGTAGPGCVRLQTASVVIGAVGDPVYLVFLPTQQPHKIVAVASYDQHPDGHGYHQ